MLVFPTSSGRFYQYEVSGDVNALTDLIEAGELRLWTADGIDGESFFSNGHDLAARIGRREAYFRLVNHRLRSAILAVGEHAPIQSGCSMGAFQASNFLFRFPDRAAGVITLSGVYSTRHFFGSALDGQIYFNSLVNYLSGLPEDDLLNRVHARSMFFCCGQGAWEEPMIEDTHHLDAVPREKGIPAWVDFWVADVSHDWPRWHKQIACFDKWLESTVYRCRQAAKSPPPCRTGGLRQPPGVQRKG